MIKFNWDKSILLTCKDGSELDVDTDSWDNEIYVYEFIICQGQCFVLRENNRAVYVGDLSEVFGMLARMRHSEDEESTQPELLGHFLSEAQSYIHHALNALK